MSDTEHLIAIRATYACAFFSLSQLQMIALSVPLWGSNLGLSAAVLGLVMAARALLPLVYSIHIGALMDELGVRRVMVAASVICVALPLVHPLVPFAGALVVLQTILGLTSALCWMGAQTAIGQLAAGKRIYVSRFSMCSVAGLVVGPVIFGLVWQWLGPVAGFFLLSLWGCGTLGAALRLRRVTSIAAARPDLMQRWPRLILPAPAAYVRAMRLSLTTAGTFLVIFSLLRLSGITIQETFYPVLLQEMGHPPSVIGMLVGLGNLVSLPASLLSDRWTRIWGGDGRALAGAIALSLGAMAATPLLTSLPLLVAGVMVFGFGVGVSMPGILNLMSTGLPQRDQGVAAGLRATANRLAAFGLPVFMGLVAGFVSLTASFWIIGGLLIGVTALAGLAARRL
jgi:MFS family permease